MCRKSISSRVFMTLAIMSFMSLPSSEAQDAPKVEDLQKEIEILKKENELQKKEIELLKKELQSKSVESDEKPEPAKKGRTRGPNLSDMMLEGKVITGTFRESKGESKGDITITISERNGNKFKGTSTIRVVDWNGKVIDSAPEIEGVINGSRFTWTTIGSANRINSTLILVRGQALEGTYKTIGGQVGSVAFKLE